MNKIVAIGIALVALVMFAGSASAEGLEEGIAGETQTYIMLGCMLAVGIAGIASVIGLALAGSSAAAVTSEKPELFGQLLVLQVLPMTQSVYGLLTAVLLMMGAGLLGGDAAVDLSNSALLAWVV